MILSETVVTSKNSEVLPLDLNKVSYRYEERLAGIEADVLRFNFPLEYTIRLGIQYDTDAVFLYEDNGEMIFSAHDLDKDGIRLRPYLYNKNGDPRSCKIDHNKSNQFFIIPKYFAEGFNVGDNINFSYHEQLLDVQERHIRVKCVK